jgi:hypothetical protein
MSSKTRSGFEPLGNMGCRLWWGSPNLLRNRNLGVWDGRWLMGVNGGKPGRFELAFEKWCRENGHAYLRTVNLFWAFQYHRKGFPTRLHYAPITKGWCEQRKQRQDAPRKIQEGRVLYFGLDLRKLSREELKSYIDYWYPDPGPWGQYYARERAYFRRELARYREAVAFWRQSADARRTFIRCAEFSNRRPESHPDYILAFGGQKKKECVFVEVKSPRESLRPSQRTFFPELVRKAAQHVLVVRLAEDGTNVRFFEFTSSGDLIACSPPGRL